MTVYRNVILLFVSIIFSSLSMADDIGALNQQAQIAYQQGDYKKASELLEQVLKQQSDAVVMTNLARIYQLQEQDDLAKTWYEKALTLNSQSLGEKHPDTLSNINNLAELYRLHGEYRKAEPLFIKTLAIRTELFGEKNNTTLTSMNNLAMLYRDTGQYDKAERLFSKVLNLRKELFGEKNTDTLLSMNNLAGLYTAQGRYNEAELLYQQGLKSSIDLLGEKHPDTLTSFNNLARIYQLQGQYDKAESLYFKNLELSKKILGEKHKHTISAINNIAVLYKNQERYELAQPLLEQALKLNKEILGENHPVTLISMNNLAGLYKEQENYTAAQSLYEQAVNLSRQLLGEKHPDTIERIGNLAALYELQKKYNDAKRLYQQAIQLNKQVLGERHPNTLLSINNLAWFYFLRQEYKKAETLLNKISKFSVLVLGESHPYTITIKANLAEVYQAMKQWHKSDKLWQDYLKNSNSFLNQVLWGATEKTRFAYLMQQENYKNNYLTFYSNQNQARQLFEFSLTRKGQLLKITSEINELSKKSQQTDIKVLLDKFTEKKQSLANNILAGKVDTQLEYDINQLELEINQRIKPKHQEQITLNQVLSKLSDKQVLIDFIIYKQVDFKTQTYKSTQLIALIINNKSIRLVKLGDMKAIDNAIKTYRTQISEQWDNRQVDLIKSSQTLYQQIWQPLLPYLNNKSEVYLIPDGSLNLLPFKALMNNKRQYLAETQQIKLLTSVSDLIKPSYSENTNKAVIFAAPDFGESTNQIKTNRTTATEARDIYFVPLKGAEVEGLAIENLIKQHQAIQLFQGIDATETAINQIVSPRFLHLATHGFFLANKPINIRLERAGQIEPTVLRRLETTENPLMRSGLALANANLAILGNKQADNTNGILTALEVLALNLQGTELVTLSACETGVGDIQVGEGVYSLNRAFQEAGAKSVLSTLWSIADKQTQLFMQEFYGLILNGVSAQDALQQTQLKFIQQKDTQDPFFWAGFTVMGK